MNMSEQLIWLDRAVALKRLGGDESLLREIAGLFLEEYPALLRDIAGAISQGDAKKLERSSHTLKGSVANFGAEAAVEATLRLEQIGRSLQLTEAEDAYRHLVFVLNHLQPELRELAG